MSSESRTSTKDTIIGLIVFISIIVGLYFLIKYILANIKIDIPVSVIVAFFSLISGLLGNYIRKNQEKEKEIELKLREKKVPTYKNIVNFHIDVLDEDKMDEEDMVKFARDITKKLLIWGSDDVIDKWVEYRSLLVERAKKMEQMNENERRICRRRFLI